MRMSIEPPDQSTRRALLLLQVIAEADSALGLMEITGRTQLDKSAVARSLQTLLDFDLVVRDRLSKRYSLGPGLVALASQMLRRLDVRTLARPAMERLGAETAETVSLHVRFGANRLCVDGVESPHALRRIVPIGELLPLHQGPTGKVILAFLADDEAADIRRAAAAAGVDLDRMDAQVAFIRERHYLAVAGDRVPGVGGLSAPVFKSQGVAAAITVAGPAERWSLERMQAFAPRLVEEAGRISAALGHPAGA